MTSIDADHRFIQGIDLAKAERKEKPTTITLQALEKIPQIKELRKNIDFPVQRNKAIEWSDVKSTDDQMEEFDQFLTHQKYLKNILPQTESSKFPTQSIKLPNSKILRVEELKVIQSFTAKGFRFYYLPLATEIDLAEKYIKENKIELKGAWTKEKIYELSKTGVTILCSALRKMPDYDGQIFRGTSVKPSDLEEMYHEGAFLYQRLFPSSTKSIDIACNFSRAAVSGKPENLPVLIVTHSKTGKDISTFSRYPKEEEVLYLPGQVFKSLGYERLNLKFEDLDKKVTSQEFVIVYLEELKISD